MRDVSEHRQTFARRLSLAGKFAVACFALVAANVLRAGEGMAVAPTNNSTTNATNILRDPPVLPRARQDRNQIVTNNASNNPLWLWLDVPTNATRTDLLMHTAISGTNFDVTSAGSYAMVTTSPWRATAILEMGSFHEKCDADPACPGSGHRSLDGWFQGIGIGAERDWGPENADFSVGLGLSVGRMTIHTP